MGSSVIDYISPTIFLNYTLWGGMLKLSANENVDGEKQVEGRDEAGVLIGN